MSRLRVEALPPRSVPVEALPLRDAAGTTRRPCYCPALAVCKWRPWRRAAAR